MIEKTNAYKVGEQFFPTIIAAQQYELQIVFQALDKPEISDHRDNAVRAAELAIKRSEEILDILTMTPTSKPRARRINGGKKTRKPSAEAVNAALQDAKQ